MAESPASPRQYPFGDSPGLDVHPEYARCRASAGLVRVAPPYGEHAWLVTRHEDIRAVLRDPRFSRATAVARDEPRLTPLPVNTSVLGLDPPEHTNLRRLLVASLAFNGRTIRALRPTVTALARGLAAEIAATGPPADLADHFALPLAGETGCELLGVPYDDRLRLRTWLEAFASTSMPAAEVEEKIEAMFAYMRELVETRRADPADDLVTTLVRAQSDDGPSDAQLVDVLSDLLLATYDNTSAQLLNAIYILLTHPDQTEEVKQNRTLLPRAIEEVMRYSPFPSQVTFARYATEDVTIGGTLIRAGEAVLPALPAGNRVDTVFHDPDTVDLARAHNPHLGFGYGLHHCLGGPLVRMELAAALDALLDTFPRLALATEDVLWRTDLLIRRPQHLFTTW